MNKNERSGAGCEEARSRSGVSAVSNRATSTSLRGQPNYIKKDVIALFNGITIVILIFMLVFSLSSNVSERKALKSQNSALQEQIQQQLQDIERRLEELESESEARYQQEGEALLKQAESLHELAVDKPAVIAAVPAPAKKPAPTATSASGQSGTYTITFYCACEKCCGKTDGITASGAKAVEGVTVAAPKSFAFGTRLNIEGFGERIVQDRGGAIKGNRLDVFVDDHQRALELGKRTAKVEVVQ